MILYTMWNDYVEWTFCFFFFLQDQTTIIEHNMDNTTPEEETERERVRAVWSVK